MKTNNKSGGFTIIEVLIVLAIAGLIMLVVFLAVPALQRNSRNTQRKNDVQGILGGLNEYIANHNGQLPDPDTATEVDSFKSNVPLGFYAADEVVYDDSIPTNIDQNKLTVITGVKCDGSDFTTNGASSRNIAVVYSLETSSSFDQVCQES